MNRETKDWKCPDCDTINIGRRCVICGSEKPPAEETVNIIQDEKQKKSLMEPKSKIIILSAVILALIVSAIAFIGNIKKYDITPKTEKTYELKDSQKEEEKTVYIEDSIYKKSFNLSVDKHGMDKHPEFSQKDNGEIVYSAPMNFKNTAGHSYQAYDETAAIKFFTRRIDKSKTISDIMAEEKRRFGNSITYETSEINWYVFLAKTNDIQYYYCEKLQDGEIVGFVFFYPSEYIDIYDDYLDELVRGLRFPLEVIEIE